MVTSMTTFPSDHSPTCSWCGAVLPSSRQVFCNDDCQGSYNSAADQEYERRHNPAELETAHVAGQPIAGASETDWFEVAAGFARAHLASTLPRR